ncbi:MAG: hypothetical protein GY810_04685 [Aureispira sp.]|nr:hypothetical protein [Aureispira sp.]
MRVKSSKYNTTIELADQPFARGGEAEIYQVLSKTRYPNHIAKIYHPSKRTAQREYKIQYLLRHAPNLGDQDIPWPKDMLYNQQGEFIGFVLPLAYGQKLEVLCLPKLPKTIHNSREWQAFDRAQPTAISYRLQVCLNLASLVAKIHAMGCYTLIDLKPDNVLVRPDATVSIIDVDSFEITEDNIELFAAKVITHEYTPPEFYRGVNPQTSIVENSWDSFSLAIIVYRTLLGIHPYAATSQAPFHNLSTLAQKIEHGLFVHSPAKPITFRHVPQPHQYFQQLPDILQNLFIDCFDDGYTEANDRPTAHQWEKGLYLALRQIQHLTIQDEIYDEEIYNPKMEQRAAIAQKQKDLENQSSFSIIQYFRAYVHDRSFIFLTLINHFIFGYLVLDFLFFNGLVFGALGDRSTEQVIGATSVLFFMPMLVQLIITVFCMPLAINELDKETTKTTLLSIIGFSLFFPVLEAILGVFTGFLDSLFSLDNPEQMTGMLMSITFMSILYYPSVCWYLLNLVLRNDEQVDKYHQKLEERNNDWVV